MREILLCENTRKDKNNNRIRTSLLKYSHWDSPSFKPAKTKGIIVIFRMTNNKSCFIFVVRVLLNDIFPLVQQQQHDIDVINTHKKDNFSIFRTKQSQCQMWDQVVLLLLHQQLTQTLMMLMAPPLLPPLQLPMLPNNNHILRWQHRFQARPTIMVFMLMKLTVQLPILPLPPKHSFGNVNYVLLGKKRDIFVSSLKMRQSFESENVMLHL